MPPLAITVTLSRMPSACKELVNSADRILDRHGNILLGDVRRGAGSAVAAVQMDDMPAGVVDAHGNHVDVVRRGDLGRKQRLAD